LDWSDGFFHHKDSYDGNKNGSEVLQDDGIGQRYLVYQPEIENQRNRPGQSPKN
jgi:hypothetical protein